MEKPFVPLGYPCSRIINPAALHCSTVRTPVEKVMFFSTTSLRKAPSRTLNTRSSGSVSEEKVSHLPLRYSAVCIQARYMLIGFFKG